MFDTISQIFVDEAAQWVVAAVLAGLTALFGLLLDQARRYFGEERVRAAQEALTPAISRAIARAEAAGLTGESLNRSAVDYVRKLLGDQLKILKPNPGDLEARIAAQYAQDRALTWISGAVEGSHR